MPGTLKHRISFSQCGVYSVCFRPSLQLKAVALMIALFAIPFVMYNH